MKQNRFKEVVAGGRPAVGHMISEFGTRAQAKLVETAGVDFVIIDMEHTGFSASDVGNIIAWLNATPVAPFVRIPQIEYHFIARCMDMGALGVMVPNVKTGDEARSVVDAVKYAPAGRRGVSLAACHTDFVSVETASYLEYANENTTVICQIESVEGLENIEAIADTPGVDVLWVGHFDLTQSMGIPGEMENSRFLDALKKVIETSRRKGLSASIQPACMEEARKWAAMGFNVLSYGCDHTVYRDALREAVQEVRSLKGG
jgi:2-dehydro-3-deoxyglucarate aldolase/4-hydroxy-2-oxoheptanedioate aldolase